MNTNIIDFLPLLEKKRTLSANNGAPWPKGELIPDHVWMYSYSLVNGTVLKKQLPDVLIEMLINIPNNPSNFQNDLNSLRQELANYQNGAMDANEEEEINFVESHVKLVISSGHVCTSSDSQRNTGLHLIIYHWPGIDGEIEIRISLAVAPSELSTHMLAQQIGLFIDAEEKENPGFMSHLGSHFSPT